jgi:queuine tRNA-ribosyltransferase
MDVVKEAGGLHKFMGWDRHVLTDSGGYQVYSLAENRRITEEGVSFNSHIDGSKHHFSPESVIDIQRNLGADIIMAFDECTPFPCEYAYAKESMDLTHRWLARCCDHFDKTAEKYGSAQTLFPIVQGSVYSDLRRISAEHIASYERDGNAIGGLSVGEPVEKMYEITEMVCDILPDDKPKYLMGVGTPENILECITLGVDMFDCVMPTRNARNGMLFTSEGIINIRNEKWKYDFTPLDDNLTGYVSKHYTKAYLRHLILSKEILGAQIASLQNLSLYLWLTGQARIYIKNGNFLEWKNAMATKVSRRL